MPLFLRLSVTDNMEWSDEPSWGLDSTLEFAKLLPGLGVDLLDVSSSGNHEKQRNPTDVRTQVGYAGTIREAVKAAGSNLLIGALGYIDNAPLAKSILEEGKGDLVLAARKFLRQPNWVLLAAGELGVPVQWPVQYVRGKR